MFELHKEVSELTSRLQKTQAALCQEKEQLRVELQQGKEEKEQLRVEIKRLQEVSNAYRREGCMYLHVHVTIQVNVFFILQWDYNWDGKGYLNTVSQTYILIRHGEYYDQTDHFQYGCLAEKGRLQAQTTGQHLVALGLRIWKMMHSTMTRARETATYINAAINPLFRMQCSSSLNEGKLHKKVCNYVRTVHCM